jgi:hypothetical protein
LEIRDFTLLSADEQGLVGVSMKARRCLQKYNSEDLLLNRQEDATLFIPSVIAAFEAFWKPHVL